MLDLKAVNGKAVIPGTGIVETGIGCKDGKIVVLAKDADLPEAASVYDAGGKYVIPGVIDPHCHLGIFTGDFAYETEHETRAALAGGVTTVGLFMGGTEPYLPQLPGLVDTLNAKASADTFLHLAMFTSQQMDEMERCVKDHGVAEFKFYMTGIPGVFPNVTDAFILQGLRRMRGISDKLTACIHCEDQSMVDAALAELVAGYGDSAGGDLCEWAKIGPAEAEELAVIRACYLAHVSGTKIYIVHMSSEEGVIAAADHRPDNLFVETTSPYLSLTKDDPAGLRAKMLPPIKDECDREALWEGVMEDIIDSFGTDNTPLSLAVKGVEKGMMGAMPGYPVIATHLPVLLHEGVNSRGVPLETIVEKACANPAKIFNLYPQKGTIAVGSDADLVVVDLDKERVVHAAELYSFADYSIWEGRTLKGWPVATIKGGVVAVENHEIRVEPGIGRYLARSI
ncbi:MAG: amidohydrolase family protein [Gaiellales bacterium]|nr:amidohydrolase family protein [Gaiellales bacterium]